ncbi:hypothetical protein J1605_021537 [Eschrichtius robustus]|uniref:EF-hand domain-containing protein n=1 Tax=Eschrichtius robustus TaxID=9764 RepID=A0AB34HHQ2_ESCRO|nr:hypothetical protein J1605_021537 [Eschrichtius robustus]
MEPDGDLEELARLRSVFAACDANRSGRLEREEFSALCAELRVRPADAEAVFQRLDADRDGAITFQEFARGFRGAHRGRRRWGRGPREPAFTAALVGSDPGDSQEDEGDEDAAAALAAHWDSASPGQAWQDFQARLGDEVKFIPRLYGIRSLSWADEEGTTVDLVQMMCPRKLKVTNNTECWVVCVRNGKVIREWGFDPALQLRALDQQHCPHPGALPAAQTVGPTTDLLKHLRFNRIPGSLVHVFSSAEEMRIEGVECSHVWLGTAIQKVEKPQKENMELRKEQVSTLYQNINLVEPRLIQPYEHVIKNFIREIKLQSTEMENLAIAVKSGAALCCGRSVSRDVELVVLLSSQLLCSVGGIRSWAPS